MLWPEGRDGDLLGALFTHLPCPARVSQVNAVYKDIETHLCKPSLGTGKYARSRSVPRYVHNYKTLLIFCNLKLWPSNSTIGPKLLQIGKFPLGWIFDGHNLVTHTSLRQVDNFWQDAKVGFR